MAVVPKKPIDKVQFFENHLEPWGANTTAIGLTTGIMTDLTSKTAAARAAYDAQQVAMDNARNATANFHDAVNVLATAGAAAIQQIRAKAAIAGNSVYTLAVIPAPATPAPVGPPGKPFDFKVELNALGGLTITWKCSNPANANGPVYQVFRQLDNVGEVLYLGGSGDKKFVDNTIPAGSGKAEYQIQAVRAAAVGEWATFGVNLGTGAILPATQEAKAKKAA